MEASAILLGGLGGAVILALVTAAISLFVRVRPPEVTKLEREQNELKLMVADVVDRLEHYMKRERVRKLRESRETADNADQVPLNTKGQLRKAARERGLLR